MSLANGGLPLRLGLHLLNTEERGPELPPEGVGPVRTGQPTWAVLGSGSAQIAPRSIFCTLDHWPLQLWALDVVISATKLRDLYAWISSLFISILGSSPFKHIGPCHLWRQVAHGRSSLIVLQNVLRTSCIFHHLIREFLQKHYTPKCTSNGELIILLVCLVVG
jgi:hypothetical protein